MRTVLKTFWGPLVATLLSLTALRSVDAAEFLWLKERSYQPAIIERKTDFLNGPLPGGVAFVEIADSSSAGRITSLTYTATKPDGERFEGTINGVTFVLPAFDWEIKPISQIVQTEHDALIDLQCIPLEIPGVGSYGHEYHFRYHPKLSNTLLGLRLAHADFMLVSPHAAVLPREKNSKTPLLGPGESVSLTSAFERATTIVTAQRLMRAKKMFSYTITDFGQDIGFDVHEGIIRQTSGAPYWYAWHPDPEKANRPVFDQATSQELTDFVRKNNGVEPVVYRALRRAAFHTAFLRRVQVDIGREEFVAFSKSISDKSIPTTLTPNLLRKE